MLTAPLHISKNFLESKLLNTHPIVEETLKNFFDQSDKKDFFKTLTRETVSSSTIEDTGTREQLGLDIRTSPQLRYQVDQLITFAESKFTLEKFVGFLIYLGQLTITAGENPLAIEIHEKIINLCSDKAGMADITANALLAIGEIYSRQAQWELSISYLDRSIKIFREENDTKGNIHCQNILGTIHRFRLNISVLEVQPLTTESNQISVVPMEQPHITVQGVFTALQERVRTSLVLQV